MNRNILLRLQHIEEMQTKKSTCTVVVYPAEETRQQAQERFQEESPDFTGVAFFIPDNGRGDRP